MAFQMHCSNPNPLIAPDVVDFIHQAGINPEYVISRRKDGKPLSRFKDKIWDCRIYGAQSAFTFESWWDTKAKGPMDTLAHTLTDEIKTIFWLSMFETTANAERSRGFAHLSQLTSNLRAMAKIAHTLRIRLAEAHTNAQFQIALRSSIASVQPGFGSYNQLVGLLKDTAFWQQVEAIECDVPRLVPEDGLIDVLSLLQQKIIANLDQREQFPLIPTRLFGNLISGALAQLEAAEPYLPHIEAYIKAAYADPALGASNRKQYRNNLRRIRRLYPDHEYQFNVEFVSLDNAFERFNLSAYAKQVHLSGLRTFEAHITHLHVLCVFLIHAFSGLRTSEVRVMPFEPAVHSNVNGFGSLPVLISHLKKFSKSGNYSRPLVWATSKEGLYAVKIAQQLTRIKWFRSNRPEKDIPSNLPLFAANSDDVRSTPNIHYELPIAPAPFFTRNWRTAIESLKLTIEAEDIEELRMFDAFREWDENPDFAVGQLWPLSSHQFRRSVAVYASRSGMVSLPTLKTQFKHLSEVMTALYSENSTYAQNFLIDENGKPIADGSVLMSFRDADRKSVV